MTLTELLTSYRQCQGVCVTKADRFKCLVISLTNQVSHYTTPWFVMMTFAQVVETVVKVFSSSPFSGLQSPIWLRITKL